MLSISTQPQQWNGAPPSVFAEWAGNPGENCHTGRCSSKDASPAECLGLSRACDTLIATALAARCDQDCRIHQASMAQLLGFLRAFESGTRLLRPFSLTTEPPNRLTWSDKPFSDCLSHRSRLGFSDILAVLHLGEHHAFSTHTTDAIDASYLCRPGDPGRASSLHWHFNSDCGHAHFRPASARLFGPSCGQHDRRNLAR